MRELRVGGTVGRTGASCRHMAGIQEARTPLFNGCRKLYRECADWLSDSFQWLEMEVPVGGSLRVPFIEHLGRPMAERGEHSFGSVPRGRA